MWEREGAQICRGGREHTSTPWVSMLGCWETVIFKKLNFVIMYLFALLHCQTLSLTLKISYSAQYGNSKFSFS